MDLAVEAALECYASLLQSMRLVRKREEELSAARARLTPEQFEEYVKGTGAAITGFLEELNP